MGYDIPGQTEGSIAGGGSTRRENKTTITDQALFVSIGSDTLEELQGYWQALPPPKAPLSWRGFHSTRATASACQKHRK